MIEIVSEPLTKCKICVVKLVDYLYSVKVEFTTVYHKNFKIYLMMFHKLLAVNKLVKCVFWLAEI